MSSLQAALPSWPQACRCLAPPCRVPCPAHAHFSRLAACESGRITQPGGARLGLWLCNGFGRRFRLFGLERLQPPSSRASAGSSSAGLPGTMGPRWRRGGERCWRRRDRNRLGCSRRFRQQVARWLPSGVGRCCHQRLRVDQLDLDGRIERRQLRCRAQQADRQRAQTSSTWPMMAMPRPVRSARSSR